MDAVESQQTDVMLVIDYAEERLDLSDVQELLHESSSESILLQNVLDAEARADEWHLLGQKLGWEVRITRTEIRLNWRRMA